MTDATRVLSAQEEFDQGRRAAKAKDYETAAKHFENADRDAPAPETLRNAIRSWQLAGQAARAATLAADALARYADDATTQALAKKVIAGSEKSLHKVDITCSPACTLLVDKKLFKRVGTLSSATVYFDPGTHEFSAGWTGDRSRTQSVKAEAGKTSKITFEAPPLPPEPAVTKPAVVASASAPSATAATSTPATEHHGLSKAVFFTTLGAAVVLGGVTIGLGVDTVNNPGHQAILTGCAQNDTTCSLYVEGRNKQMVTNVMIGVTGAVGLAAVVIGAAFTDWASDTSAPVGVNLGPLLGVVPVAGVQGGGLGGIAGAAGRF